MGVWKMEDISLKFSLNWKDDLDRKFITEFHGELLSSVTKDTNHRTRSGLWRRIHTWSVYRTQSSTIVYHYGMREIGSSQWDGLVKTYPRLPDLLREMHESVGREGPIAKLRAKLLAVSLTEDKTDARETPKGSE
jgi:hypothetical protein